ncbi:MAG: o-succinylbenzoate synthase [Acidimicrobiales bacterium]|nr:o-succinylbenzoate synthase [Acidimicrobiales bacterium]
MISDLSQLEVREIQLERVTLQFHNPISTFHGPLTTRDVIILTASDASGNLGFGEAAPLAGFTPETLQEVENALSEWARDSDPGHLTGRPTAQAAVDAALLDLASQIAGRPLHDLINPGSPSVLPVSALINGQTPEEAAESAGAAVDAGYKTVKLKVGLLSFSEDIARVAAVRTAVGDTKFRVDANGAWRPTEAIDHLTRLNRYHLEFIEEPVRGLEALAAVRANSPVPVASDESVRTIDDLHRAIKLGSADIVVLKPSALGGPQLTAAAAQVAIDAGLPVVLTSLLESSVGIRSTAHLASALGALDPAPGLATATLLATDSGTPFLPIDGQLHLG